MVLNANPGINQRHNRSEMEPTTIAEFWDCELEHSEAKQSWVNEHLLQVIRRTLGTNAPRNLDVEAELRKMAES